MSMPVMVPLPLMMTMDVPMMNYDDVDATTSAAYTDYDVVDDDRGGGIDENVDCTYHNLHSGNIADKTPPLSYPRPPPHS